MWNSLGVCPRTVLFQVLINDLETEWHRLCSPIKPADGKKWRYKLVCPGEGCLWVGCWIQQGHIWDGSTACSSVCWGLPCWREVLREGGFVCVFGISLVMRMTEHWGSPSCLEKLCLWSFLKYREKKGITILLTMFWGVRWTKWPLKVSFRMFCSMFLRIMDLSSFILMFCVGFHFLTCLHVLCFSSNELRWK